MKNKKLVLFLSVIIAITLFTGVDSSFEALNADNFHIDFAQKSDNGTSELFGMDKFENVPADSSVSGVYVIPSGMTVGIKINIDGVMILGFSDIRDGDGHKVCPGKDCGLKVGDIVVRANGKRVKSVTDLTDITENNNGQKIELAFLRKEQEKTAMLKPVYSSEDNKYKIGMWVRDATSGIGTVTYIMPESGDFAALGHPVTDADTGEIIDIGTGYVYTSSIMGINKGTRGSPGELLGIIDEENVTGEITDNNRFGIFGNLKGNYNEKDAIPVAVKGEVKPGKASILANINGTVVEEFEVELLRVYTNSYDNKGIVLKVTDERLLQKTGGIVQGMSGSPIIQNGKLAGAVTHVFVNDPTRGYGILAGLMVGVGSDIPEE